MVNHTHPFAGHVSCVTSRLKVSVEPPQFSRHVGTTRCDWKRSTTVVSSFGHDLETPMWKLMVDWSLESRPIINQYMGVQLPSNVGRTCLSLWILWFAYMAMSPAKWLFNGLVAIQWLSFMAKKKAISWLFPTDNDYQHLLGIWDSELRSTYVKGR